MEEDPEDTQRTDILDQEDIHVEEMCHTQCPIIGKLIAHQLMRHKPANKYTCQESHHWKEYLPCYEVEDVKQRFLENMEH
jgi:hypothetical protein